MIESNYTLANVTTVQLWWHVQCCYLIWSLFSCLRARCLYLHNFWFFHCFKSVHIYIFIYVSADVMITRNILIPYYYLSYSHSSNSELCVQSTILLSLFTTEVVLTLSLSYDSGSMHFTTNDKSMPSLNALEIFTYIILLRNVHLSLWLHQDIICITIGSRYLSPYVITNPQ